MEQDEMEETPYPTAQMMQPPQMSDGLLQYQLEVEDIIDNLIHAIKCEVEIPDKTGRRRWVTSANVKPLINESGIISIISELKPRLTKIFILSDLDEEQIITMTIDLARTIKDDFRDNWDIYEVRDTTAASKILHLITDSYYVTLRKAHLGGYLKFLKTTTQEIQHHQSLSQGRPQQQSQQSRGIPIMDRILGR